MVISGYSYDYRRRLYRHQRQQHQHPRQEHHLLQLQWHAHRLSGPDAQPARLRAGHPLRRRDPDRLEHWRLDQGMVMRADNERLQWRRWGRRWRLGERHLAELQAAQRRSADLHHRVYL